MYIHESLADYIEYGITSFQLSNIISTIEALKKNDGFNKQFEVG